MPEAYAMPAAATAPLLTAARVRLPLLPLNSYSLHRQCTAALLTVARWTPFALSTGNAPHRLWHEPRRRGRACDGSNGGLPSRQPGRRWPHGRLWRFARHCWVRHHHAGFSRLPQAFHCLPSLPSPSHALHPLLIPFHRFPSPSIAFHPLPCRYDTTTLLAASFRRIYDGDPDAPLALSACGASKFNAAAYGSFGRDPWTCDPALAPLSTQLASLVAQCSESAHAPLGGREVKRFAEGGFATMQVRADEPRAFHRLRMPSIAFSRLASPSHAFCGFHATVQLPLEASENASAAPPCFGEVRSFHRLLSPSLRPSHGLL